MHLCQHPSIPSLWSVLIDSAATLLYVSTYFSVEFDMICDIMHEPIHVSTLVCYPLVVHRVYRSYLVSLEGCDTWVDLIIRLPVDFDVILGMTYFLLITLFFIVMLILCP